MPGAPFSGQTGPLPGGCFRDPAAHDCSPACGIACQTFNPEVGATQSPEHIAHDFDDSVRLRAASVRCARRGAGWCGLLRHRGRMTGKGCGAPHADRAARPLGPAAVTSG
jgi:hypothetical protein